MIKSILGGKSKNLCDLAYLLTLPLDKTFSNQGFWRVLINAEPNTTYTFSRENANQITGLGIDYLLISAYDDISHNQWLNHPDIPGACNKSATLTTGSDGKLWILFNETVYNNYWQKNINPFGYIQLELGSAATEYVPHELTSYKSIMKVSDVCQLVPISDKADKVVNGVTFTNNHDGGWVVSGTNATTNSVYLLFSNVPLRKGHIYLKGTFVLDSTYTEIKFKNKDNVVQWGRDIYTADENSKCDISLLRAKGATSDVILKPQLFDLTEMFGAGNEPKTVAEFKAKFQNDYYPYSPSCFVTSFDERMPCKTKNLFSSSTEVGIPSNTKSDASEKRLLEDGKWYVGFSKNNYYRGPQSDWLGNFQYNIWENSISIYTNSDGFGLAKCVYVEPNTKYTISCKVNGPDINIGCGFYQEDGTFISYLSGKEITTPQNCKFMTIVFSLGIDKNKVTHYVSDIQLVKGTTATDYVPYGYV